MTTEFRATLNTRLTNDMNASFTLTVLADTVEDAQAAGAKMNQLINGWVDGYTAAIDEREAS